MNEESAESSGPPAEKKDVVAGFKEMGKAEKLVAVGAAGFVLAFVVGNSWKLLFRFSEGWAPTLGFVGALGVLVLVITRLLGIKLVDAKLGAKLLVLAAVLPALGWVIDELRNFWYFLALVSMAVMAFGASKLIAPKD